MFSNSSRVPLSSVAETIGGNLADLAVLADRDNSALRNSTSDSCKGTFWRTKFVVKLANISSNISPSRQLDMKVRSAEKVMLSLGEGEGEGEGEAEAEGENIEAAGRPKEQLLNHQAIVRAKIARGELG